MADLIAAPASPGLFRVQELGEVDLARLVAAKGEAFDLTATTPYPDAELHLLGPFAQERMRSRALATTAGMPGTQRPADRWLGLKRQPAPANRAGLIVRDLINTDWLWRPL